jgi:hypothetical protein
MFDVIERLKSEWTDKYVVIASSAPELARFAHATGVVKTVNMNGRCLVEFDQFNNVGWYDIDPAALKVVPKPLPKPPEAKEKAAKPVAAKDAAKPAAKTTAKPAAGKPSTADILAAARGKAAATDKPAAAKPAAGKLSTAEILAQARGGKAAAPPAAEQPGDLQSATDEPVTVEEEPAAPPATSKPAAAKAAAGGLPTTTAEKIAWCRTHDAKG